MSSDATDQFCDTNPIPSTGGNFFKNAVNPLAEGLSKICNPSLTQTAKLLKELTDKESTLFEQIHDENLNLSATQHSDELNEMFNKIETYQAKLIAIKKDMKHLHEKSTKLKKRALKIQQIKEKQDYMKQQKEAEIKMEQDLIPKTSTSK